MSRALKILEYAVCVTITCALITLLISGFVKASKLGQQGLDETGQIGSEISSAWLLDYDGQEIYGSQVINLAKQLRSKGDAYTLTVENGATTYGVVAQFSSVTGEVELEQVDTTSSKLKWMQTLTSGYEGYYVVSGSKYLAIAVYVNNEFIGLRFIRQ